MFAYRLLLWLYYCVPGAFSMVESLPMFAYRLLLWLRYSILGILVL